MSDKRVSVAVSAAVHKRFGEVCKGDVGRSMNDAANRLLAWFCRQEDYVRTAVMSATDKGMEASYAAALRRLADELEGGARDRPPPFTADEQKAFEDAAAQSLSKGKKKTAADRFLDSTPAYHGKK